MGDWQNQHRFTVFCSGQLRHKKSPLCARDIGRKSAPPVPDSRKVGNREKEGRKGASGGKRKAQPRDDPVEKNV